MKKFILISALTVSAFSFNWNSLVGVFKKTVHTISYTIESSGLNPRVYEFDTQGYPKMHCVALFRNDTRTSPAMWCTETKPEYIKLNEKIK